MPNCFSLVLVRVLISNQTRTKFQSVAIDFDVFPFFSFSLDSTYIISEGALLAADSIVKSDWPIIQSTKQYSLTVGSLEMSTSAWQFKNSFVIGISQSQFTQIERESMFDSLLWFGMTTITDEATATASADAATTHIRIFNIHIHHIECKAFGCGLSFLICDILVYFSHSAPKRSITVQYFQFQTKCWHHMTNEFVTQSEKIY